MRRFGLLAFVLVLIASATARADGLVVILHPDRTDDLELADIVQIYLKQRRYWSNGDPIVPVNREAGSSTREQFARAVFGEGSRGQTSYWNREYFRGVLPPATLASDEAVLRFVAAEPRAISYIRAELVDDRVRIAFRLPAANPAD